MNRIYIILPVVLMVAFAFLYRGHSKEAAEAARQKQVQVELKKKEEDRKKEELNQKALADAERRTQERLKEEQAREDKRVAKYQETIQKLKDELKKYTDEIETNTKKTSVLEKNLADLRARREKENRELLELTKKVELTKIARQNAELEVQRYTEMISRRAAESAMAKAPAVATAEK